MYMYSYKTLTLPQYACGTISIPVLLVPSEQLFVMAAVISLSISNLFPCNDGTESMASCLPAVSNSFL